MLADPVSQTATGKQQKRDKEMQKPTPHLLCPKKRAISFERIPQQNSLQHFFSKGAGGLESVEHGMMHPPTPFFFLPQPTPFTRAVPLIAGGGTGQTQSNPPSLYSSSSSSNSTHPQTQNVCGGGWGEGGEFL